MIEDVLEISPSRDLLTFDVEKNQDKINNIDFIRSSRVSKIFPSTVVIEIIENEPIAHVIKNNKDFILDENGNYLPFSKRILNYYSIPKLYFKEVTNNLEIVQSSIEKDFGLKLKDIKNSFPQIYNQISKIDYSQFGDLRFVIKQNTEIYMKENKIDLHFKILDEFKQISQNYTNYELIDLRVNGQLIVKESKFKKS
jgi:cell division septal protein FtsQ